MDVTPQIQEFHRIYGGSDNTNQGYTSSSRALNYSKGASIQRPELEQVSTIPKINAYQDAVGLFGAENHFVKVNMNLQNPIRGDYIVNGYIPAKLSEEIQNGEDPYTIYNNGYLEDGQAFIDYDADPETFNTYEPAEINGDVINRIESQYFKVELFNRKTGNIYIDDWLDVRLYNKAYDEHPYDVMYVKYNEPFYIGFHARNTKRLPYNVQCIVGGYSLDEDLPPFGELGEFDKRYLATRR